VISPQAYLDAMLRSRGYNTTRFKSLQTAYYNKPTQLQNASYDLHLVQLVRKKDIDGFRAIMASGISPNPCNSFGESTLHMVCRKGETEFLKVMLEAGASVQVADDYGRSPLTDACWCARPCFDVVRLILEKDPRLFHLTDCRGAVPLSYVPPKDWAAWLVFLESIKDDFWPKRDARVGEQEPPELALLGANTRPLPNSPNALTVELAAMVASGKMTPDEAHFLVHDKTECSTNDGSEDEGDDGDDSDDSDDDSDDSDDDSDDSDYDSEDDDDDFTLNEDEMADILSTLTLPKN
jgi:Ankyrin repeats (3 copies)